MSHFTLKLCVHCVIETLSPWDRLKPAQLDQTMDNFIPTPKLFTAKLSSETSPLKLISSHITMGFAKPGVKFDIIGGTLSACFSFFLPLGLPIFWLLYRALIVGDKSGL